MADLAAIQAGVVHRRQLAALGISRCSVAHRLAVGTLHRIYPSVFAVGHAHLDDTARRYAVLLHVGEDCALSHGTSGAEWGLCLPPVHLRATVVRRHVRDYPLLTVHRVARLDSRDVRMRHGLPVTAPARTVIDLAAAAPGDELEEALARARALRLLDDRELDGALERAPLRTGAAALRRLLGTPQGRVLTRSRFERKLLALLQDAGLPLPEFNVRANGVVVDAVWRAQRLVLECDSWEFHGDREAFETDRSRDQRHAAAGYRVVRITWRQLTEQPLLVASRIAAALAAASP